MTKEEFYKLIDSGKVLQIHKFFSYYIFKFEKTICWKIDERIPRLDSGFKMSQGPEFGKIKHIENILENKFTIISNSLDEWLEKRYPGKSEEYKNYFKHSLENTF